MKEFITIRAKCKMSSSTEELEVSKIFPEYGCMWIVCAAHECSTLFAVSRLLSTPGAASTPVLDCCSGGVNLKTASAPGDPADAEAVWLPAEEVGAARARVASSHLCARRRRRGASGCKAMQLKCPNDTICAPLTTAETLVFACVKENPSIAVSARGGIARFSCPVPLLINGVIVGKLHRYPPVVVELLIELKLLPMSKCYVLFIITNSWSHKTNYFYMI